MRVPGTSAIRENRKSRLMSSRTRYSLIGWPLANTRGDDQSIPQALNMSETWSARVMVIWIEYGSWTDGLRGYSIMYGHPSQDGPMDHSNETVCYGDPLRAGVKQRHIGLASLLVILSVRAQLSGHLVKAVGITSVSGRHQDVLWYHSPVIKLELYTT